MRNWSPVKCYLKYILNTCINVQGSLGIHFLVPLRSLRCALSNDVSYVPIRLTLGHKNNIITSVSYTHLRAHETVLDLVCRLLLEKKKKKNHIPVVHENK